MLLNGQPASEINLLDRGLAYGDGLFETMLIHQHKVVFLAEHLTRLQRGCEQLGMELDQAALDAELAQMLASSTASNGVLKVMVTRHAGGRGYRPGAATCNRILTMHPALDYRDSHPEQGIAMFVCRQRLSRQPALAGLKHLNRLEQVLASREWPDESCMEGLMLDTEGLVIEGTRSNLFAVIKGKLLTPDLSLSGVAGVMRNVLLANFGAAVTVSTLTLEQVRQAEEIFVCNSINGIWPVLSLQTPGETWHFTSGHRAQQAQACFVEALV